MSMMKMVFDTDQSGSLDYIKFVNVHREKQGSKTKKKGVRQYETINENHGP